jgi:hypothetical protein
MKQIRNNRNTRVSLFTSFKEENIAEHSRLAHMTPNQRLTEFGALQKRVWGKKWTSTRMIKTSKIERLTWA